jgi:hypothetical protein
LSIPELKNPSHYLCPVSIFIDGAHLDQIGRMCVEPVIIELLSFSSAIRKTDKSKVLLGFLPPYPVVTAQKNEEARSTKSKLNYMEFYHRALRLVLKDLVCLENDKEGLAVDIPGMGQCFLHIRLAFVVGDIKGQNPMACHMASFSSNVSQMLPSCDCPQSHSDLCEEHQCKPCYQVETDNEIDRCIRIIQGGEHGAVGKARLDLKKISKIGVVSAFRDFKFGNNPAGIYGSLPIETLHAWLLGLMEYELEGVYSYVTPSKEIARWTKLRYIGDPRGSLRNRPTQVKFMESLVKTDQGEFERRIKIAKTVCTRQSDRDVPKTPFNNGVTSLSRLTGQEYPGLVMLTMVSLDGMLPTSKSPNFTLCKQFSLLLWWTLSLNVSLNKPTKTNTEVNLLETKIHRFLKLYRELIGPQREMRSKCGIRIVKFHALTHFPRKFREFGCTSNYFGGPFESCIKTMAKCNLARTSRKHGSFVPELMKRYFEQQVCQVSSMVLDSIHLPSQAIEKKNDVLPKEIMSKSGFSVVYCPLKKKWFTMGKKLKHSNKLFHPLRDNPLENHWLLVLTRYLVANGVRAAEIGFKLTLRDTTNNTTQSDIFRCHPNIYSDCATLRPWYDFANVLFDMGHDVHEKYPAKVRLFAIVKYPSGEEEVVCVIQQFTNNEQTKRTASKLLPFLQQDRLSSHYRVVKASSMECIFVLPCQFPDQVDDCTEFIISPPQEQWDRIGW